MVWLTLCDVYLLYNVGKLILCHPRIARQATFMSCQRLFESAHYLRIELCSGAAEQFVEGPDGIMRGLVITFGDDGVVGIGNGHDTGTQGNIRSGKTVGVALAVPAFVMRPDNGNERAQRGYAADNLGSQDGMLLHGGVFFLVQSFGFLEYRIWYADLADIVQASSQSDHTRLGAIQAERVCDLGCQRRHAARGLAGVLIVCLDQGGQSFDGSE